jgi:hypothetical protein
MRRNKSLMTTHKWSRLTTWMALGSPGPSAIYDIGEAPDGSLLVLEDADPAGLFQSIWETKKGDCHACRTHIA